MNDRLIGLDLGLFGDGYWPSSVWCSVLAGVGGRGFVM